MAKQHQDSDKTTQVLVWIPLLIVVVSLVVGMVLRSKVDEVAADSTEMVETTNYVDSPASLKTIIVTLNNQYVRAEDSWSQTLSVVLFLLFLVSVIAIIQWVRLYQLFRQDLAKKRRHHQEE